MKKRIARQIFYETPTSWLYDQRQTKLQEEIESMIILLMMLKDFKKWL